MISGSIDGTIFLWKYNGSTYEPVSCAMSWRHYHQIPPQTEPKAFWSQTWKNLSVSNVAESSERDFMAAGRPGAGSAHPNRFAMAGKDQIVRLLRIDSDLSIEPASVEVVRSDDVIMALAFSPDGKWLAVGGRDSRLRLFDCSGDRPRGERGPGSGESELYGHHYEHRLRPQGGLSARGGQRQTADSHLEA